MPTGWNHSRCPGGCADIRDHGHCDVDVPRELVYEGETYECLDSDAPVHSGKFKEYCSEACGLCQAHVCTCQNGTPVSNCTNAKEDCDHCNDGFHIADGICKANVCTCQNGTLVSDYCATDGKEDCDECNDGFQHIDDGSCKALVCPAGIHGSGGTCDCEGAPGWDTTWFAPWCHEGVCYAGVTDSRCSDAVDGFSLGDGTWCFSGTRNTRCPIGDHTAQALVCPAGDYGPGGTCDCKGASGWDATWLSPWCHEGVCLSRVAASECDGVAEGNGFLLDDSTWCEAGYRSQRCTPLFVQEADCPTGYSLNHNGYWANYRDESVGETAASCGQRCEADNACVAFTFGGWHGDCGLYSAPVGVETSTVEYIACSQAVTTATTTANTPIAAVSIPTTIAATARTNPDVAQEMLKAFHGTLLVQISDATNFIAESRMPQVLKLAIASWLEIDASWVQNVSISRIQGTNSQGVRILSEWTDDLQLHLRGNVRIDFDVLVPLDGEDPHILATVIMHGSDSTSLEEASDAINKVLASGFFGEKYILTVEYKDLEVIELPPSQASSQDYESDWVVVVSILTISFACAGMLGLAVCVRRWRNLSLMKQGRHSERESSFSSDSDLLKAAGPLGSSTVEELLSPPVTISESEKSELHTLISSLCWSVDAGKADVFISYALASRDEDVEGSGPGLYYVAALLKVLYVQGLNCVVPIPGLLGRRDFLSMIQECSTLRRVLLVVETQELFHCRESMQEIHAAQAHSFEIRRLRYDGNLSNLPDLENKGGNCLTWNDALAMRKYDRMEKMAYFDLPLCPDPPLTILEDPKALHTVALDIQLEIGHALERPPMIGNSTSGDTWASCISFGNAENEDPYRISQQKSTRSLPAIPTQGVAVASQNTKKRGRTTRKLQRPSEQEVCAGQAEGKTSGGLKLPMATQEDGEQENEVDLEKGGTRATAQSPLSFTSSDRCVASVLPQEEPAVLAPPLKKERKSISKGQKRVDHCISDGQKNVKEQRPSIVRKSRVQRNDKSQQLSITTVTKER